MRSLLIPLITLIVLFLCAVGQAYPIIMSCEDHVTFDSCSGLCGCYFCYNTSACSEDDEGDCSSGWISSEDSKNCRRTNIILILAFAVPCLCVIIYGAINVIRDSIPCSNCCTYTKSVDQRKLLCVP